MIDPSANVPSMMERILWRFDLSQEREFAKKYIEPKSHFLAGVITMNEKAKSEKIQAQILRNAFEA